MLPWIEHFNNWSQLGASLVWAIVWQSTLLVLLVALLALALRRSSPGLRYWLWQIVAIKLLLMPFWTYAVPLPSLFESDATDESTTLVESDAATLPGAPHRPIGSSPSLTEQIDPRPDVPTRSPLEQITWQSWLLLGWLGIVVLLIARILWQRFRLARLLGRASPADEAVQKLVNQTAEQLGMRRAVRTVLTEIDCSPFVCGVRRAVLVLPQTLVKSLDESRLTQVLFHELAHVHRRDLLWGWIPEIARIVYFFHPMVYWVCYRVRLERELACDQIAMAFTGGDAREYAETLIQVVSHTSQPCALKAAAGSSIGLGVMDQSLESTRESSK